MNLSARHIEQGQVAASTRLTQALREGLGSAIPAALSISGSGRGVHK